MKAVVYQEVGKLNVEEVPVPNITEPRDALVRVTAAAICGSDVHMKYLDPGFLQPGQIIGHEYVGVVEEIGCGITDLQPGDRVAGSCIRFCGRCENCRRGLYAHCTNFGCFGSSPLLDGAQAEYIRVPYADCTLFNLEDRLSDDQALFVGDILSTGYMAAQYGEVCPGSVVAVFGCGPVGMCAMMCARLFSPAVIIGIEPNPERRRVCIEKKLADIMIDPYAYDPVMAIYEQTNFRGADTCIEAIGKERTLMQAIQAVRPSGNVTTVGFFTEPVQWDLRTLWLKNMTIRHGFVQVNQVPRLISLLENHRLDPAFLITHRLPLSSALQGYEIFENQLDGAIKVVLTP